MKRILLVAISLVAFSSTSSHAQLVRYFGLKTGLNLATQSWEQRQPVINLNPLLRPGAEVGVFVEWLNLPLFSVCTEVLYQPKGFKSTNSAGSGIIQTEEPLLGYLTFSVLAKCRWEIGLAAFYAVAGPQVSVLVHKQTEGYSQVIVNQVRSSELGGTIGIGFEALRAGPVGLGAEVRYSPSFQSCYADDIIEVRNRSFEFLAVIAF